MNSAGPTPPPWPRTGVADQERLDVVARLGLSGHLGDPDLDAVVETLVCALDVPLAVVDVITPELQTYLAEQGVGAPCSRVPDALSFCARVVETGEPLHVADARDHPVYRSNPLVREGQVGSYAGFPLVLRGAVVGAVAVFDRTPRTFRTPELAVLGAQARLAASVLSLRWAAAHDALTGLANRRQVVPRAEQALQDPPVSLLFLDVDDFKAVNDRHGHARGDAVLQQVAERLQRATSGTPRLAARWGGDEFLVLLPGEDRVAAQQLGEELVRSVQHAPGGLPSITVGTATAATACGWDELLRCAADAAARGKREGKAQSVRGADRGDDAVGGLRAVG